MSRYTVDTAIFSENKFGPEISLHIVLDDGIPDIIVNKVLLSKFRNKKYRATNRPENTSNIYRWCKFANFIWENYQKTYMEVSMEEIINFFYYLSTKCDMKYKSLCAYVGTLSKVYENLAIRHFPISDTLLKPTGAMILKSKSSAKNNHITYISYIKCLFSSKEDEFNLNPIRITHLDKHQINKLSNIMRIDYACIFLLSVYTGFRISSILSLKLDSVDLNRNIVHEQTSKTGQTHSVSIPEFLAFKLKTYITEVRSSRKSESTVLFIGTNGTPITYNAYYKALNKAASDLGFSGTLGTHTGRRTFLSSLRSFQLEKERMGEATFTDNDICQLMDWSSMQCLRNYDQANRIQEVSPMLSKVQKKIYNGGD